MNEHIVRSYEDELNQLAAEVVRMGGLAEAQVNDSIQAFARRDVPLAQAMISRDGKLDTMEAEIERAAIRMIALRQPMANDLRRARKTNGSYGRLDSTGGCNRLAESFSRRFVV